MADLEVDMLHGTLQLERHHKDKEMKELMTSLVKMDFFDSPPIFASAFLAVISCFCYVNSIGKGLNVMFIYM